MPRLVACFLLITLSSIALPGTNGFIGEFLILLGGYLRFPRLTVFAATGVILSAVYMLWMFQRVNYGEVTNEKNRNLPDLSPREWALMIPTIAVAIFMGVAPGFFLRTMEPSVLRTLDRINETKVTSADPRSEERGERREKPTPVAQLAPRLAPPASHLRQGYGAQARLEVRR